MMRNILILPLLTTLLCISKSQSQNPPPARPGSDPVDDGPLGPGSLRFSTKVEDRESLRPRFKLFRSSDVNFDEDEREETTPASASLSGSVDQELAVEDDVSKSRSKFRLFRFIMDDDSPNFSLENLQPASTITRTESLTNPRALETATVTLEGNDDKESINIFGSTNFQEEAEDIEGRSSEIKFSGPSPNEMTELENSQDVINTSKDENDDIEEEESESLLSLSGMMKFVSSLMSSNKSVKDHTEETTATLTEEDNVLPTPTLSPDTTSELLASSVPNNPEIESSEESTLLPREGEESQEDDQDAKNSFEQVSEANHSEDLLSATESGQRDAESTPDPDEMEKEVEKMMDDMLTDSAKSLEVMKSGSAEVVGRDQLGEKFKPLVIEVLGSFKCSNLTLNGKVEKLQRALISESPSIIRSHFESSAFDVHARHLIQQHAKIRSTALTTTSPPVATPFETTTSSVQVTTKAPLLTTSSSVPETPELDSLTSSATSTTSPTTRTTTNRSNQQQIFELSSTTPPEQKQRKVKFLDRLSFERNTVSANLAATTVKPTRKVVWSTSTFPLVRSVASSSNPRNRVSSQRFVSTNLDFSNVRQVSSNQDPKQISSRLHDEPRTRRVQNVKLSSPSSFTVRGGSVFRNDNIPFIRAENVKINIGDVKVTLSDQNPRSFVKPTLDSGRVSSSSFRRQSQESAFSSSSFKRPRQEGTRIVRRIFN